MILKDILKKFNYKDFTTIEYRKIISIDSDDVDVLVGHATFVDGVLSPSDYDNYSLEDEIIKYKLYRTDWLVVWI